MGVSAERRNSQGCSVGTGHLASGWSLQALTEHLLGARPLVAMISMGPHHKAYHLPILQGSKAKLGEVKCFAPNHRASQRLRGSELGPVLIPRAEERRRRWP